jgi:hypothetical protein
LQKEKSLKIADLGLRPPARLARMAGAVAGRECGLRKGARCKAQGKETADLRSTTLDIEAVDFVLRFF